MSDWRPIETAPEIQEVLLYESNQERIGVGMFVTRSDGTFWTFENAGRHEFHCRWRFTHWMPLPEPPEEP